MIHIETLPWYNLKVCHNSISNFSAQMPSDNEHLINVMNKRTSDQYKLHNVNKHIIVNSL